MNRFTGEEDEIDADDDSLSTSSLRVMPSRVDEYIKGRFVCLPFARKIVQVGVEINREAVREIFGEIYWS